MTAQEKQSSFPPKGGAASGRRGIYRKKDHVEEQNQGANADSNSAGKKESVERVVPEEREEDESAIKEIAMQVLKNKRKRSFATIMRCAASLTAQAGGSRKKAR